MKESQRPKKYICSECPKAYSRPCLLKQHQRTHLNSRPFKCDTCGKGFFRDTHLKVHNFTHQSEKPLSCEVCQKGFITNQQLRRHMNTHPMKFNCPYECDEKFVGEQELSDHILSDHVMSDVIDVDVHKSLVDASKEGNGPEFTPCGLVVTGPLTSDSNSSSSISISPGTNSTNGTSPSDSIDYFKNWEDHLCKEPSCAGSNPFDDFYGLITHYDEGHKYVPETLLEALDPLVPWE